MPNNQHPSQRIGVAKGAFEVPDTIDASNAEVVALLLGEPMRKQEIERVRTLIQEGLVADDNYLERRPRRRRRRRSE